MIKRYFAPNGLPIVGTLESISAIALIEGIDSTTGDAIYTGDTDVQWDSQKTVTFRQQPIFLDSAGNQYRFSQLKAADCEQKQLEAN